MRSILSNKKVFLTGGTGSFGKCFIKHALESDIKEITIFSRDEMKQWNLQQRFQSEKRLRFVIGDVRDLSAIQNSLDDSDTIIHAAATKIVPTAEYNPAECVKTNILGALNVIEAVRYSKVKKVVALSTDKASAPINLYGATKLVSDKLFVAANLNSDTAFSIVRYGNVMGSRGSVIPFFIEQSKSNRFTITDERMTRFMISLDDGVELVKHALIDMIGGEIYVKKIPSMKVLDIANTINPSAEIELIGIRPGEKLHEQMIGLEDAPFTYEYDNHYKILPSINNWYLDEDRIKEGVKVESNFQYSSDSNDDWMQPEFLSNYLVSKEFIENSS
jgi:UDP-N-acetylglucosamine 4,6-dehydratase (inverting)